MGSYSITSSARASGVGGPSLIYKLIACLGAANAPLSQCGNPAEAFHCAPAIGKIRMIGIDELKATIRRNKFLGMWAAEKLGLQGRDAEAYAEALAVGTVDPERRDVFSKIRKDFDAAGVLQSDEQILHIMNEFALQAMKMQATGGGASDAATVMLVRNLTKR
jgi:hypothetical protein